MREEQEKKPVGTAQGSDVNSKVIFGNNKLCAQFLNDYVDIPFLKEIRPEDIEDVKERYHFFDDVELNADTVKRIRIKGTDRNPQNEGCLYLVSLIDHKSQVDYNVSMQLLRYMVCIWYDWEKEMSAGGKQKRKNYHYPPILPIVYYEGKGEWTAGCHLKDRILLSEFFAEYIPDFRYQVIRIQDFGNEELLDKGDEISLLMLINKIRNINDMRDFGGISPDELNRIMDGADEEVLNIISAVVQSLCRKFNLPEDETAQYVGKVKERDMGYLFENMEKMDIQAERRNTAEARERAAKAEARADEAERKLHEAEQHIFVETLQELGQDKESIVQRVCEKFGIDEVAAEKMVNVYFK